MSRRAPEFDDDDLDYDEGFEDAGEEEEMSAEDRAAMDQAKAQVSTVMGADYRKLTTKDVEDTLWHYFYDIEKSVAYLRKTYLAAPAPKPAPKAAPKKAPEGTSRELSFFASIRNLGEGSGADREQSMDGAYSGYLDEAANVPSILPPVSFPFGGSHASFFSDMPWLDVPQHRQTTFLEPPRPRGGLLGGSDGGPKMSKLQALAAARKKKTEMKEGAETATATSTENDMKRLSISDQKKENEKPGLGFAKKQKTIDTRAPLSDQLNARKVTALSPDEPSQAQSLPGTQAAAATTDDRVSEAEDPENAAVMSTPQAPSSFAKTLFGSAPGTSKPKRDVFAMPYASSSAYSAGAFAKPSPDDIVLTAQAKGSSFTQTK
jgi:elongation factor 1 alpha-like protein